MTIRTVTLNPSIDIDGQVVLSGGMGINVGRTLRSFFAPVRDYTIAGGENRHRLEELLAREGADYSITPTRSNIRTSTVVSPERIEESTTFMPDPQEVNRFLEHVYGAIKPGDYVIVASSIPAGVFPELLASIADMAEHKRAHAVTDSSTPEATREAASVRPYLHKSNDHEFRRAFGDADPRDVMDKYGIERMMVTRGKDGLSLYVNDHEYRALVPAVPVISTVGSGDSATAGCVYGFVHRWGPIRLAGFSAAAGTASVLHQGTGGCTLLETERMFRRIRVEEYNGEPEAVGTYDLAYHHA